MSHQPNFENLRRALLREGPPGPVPLFEIGVEPGVMGAVLGERFPLDLHIFGPSSPLPPGEEKKEQDKLTRSIAERREQTAAQRAQRLAEYNRRPEWQREAWRELPEAFDFRLAGEEVRDGHALYVIQATPYRGYQPRSRTAKVLVHLQGKLWVDKLDYHLVKAEVEVVDTISVGLFLVRVAKGSRAAFEQTRVNDEVWLPRHVRAFVSARLGLLKVLRIEEEISYSKCRESQTDSPIISQLKTR